MPDCSKHSFHPRPAPRTGATLLPLVLLAAFAPEPEPDDPSKDESPETLFEWPRAAPGDYSIRLAPSPDLFCPTCSSPIGEGPIGFRSVVPVCDACFLKACPDLGFALAMVNAVRSFANETLGSVGFDNPMRAMDDSFSALINGLGTFEDFARRWGTPRPSHLYVPSRPS